MEKKRRGNSKRKMTENHLLVQSGAFSFRSVFLFSWPRSWFFSFSQTSFLFLFSSSFLLLLLLLLVFFFFFSFSFSELTARTAHMTGDFKAYLEEKKNKGKKST